MKRIALVHPRYGLEISGGSETYARKIAEHLANRYEVEVLTTKAVDSATWKDWYVRDVDSKVHLPKRPTPRGELSVRLLQT